MGGVSPKGAGPTHSGCTRVTVPRVVATPHCCTCPNKLCMVRTSHAPGKSDLGWCVPTPHQANNTQARLTYTRTKPQCVGATHMGPPTIGAKHKRVWHDKVVTVWPT